MTKRKQIDKQLPHKINLLLINELYDIILFPVWLLLQNNKKNYNQIVYFFFFWFVNQFIIIYSLVFILLFLNKYLLCEMHSRWVMGLLAQIFGKSES
jgi:hypothetical protein